MMRLLLLLLAFFFPLCASVKKERGAPFGSVLASTTVPTIVIDPGHGGTDHGARAKAPFCEEKRICLQTARLVKKYLDQLGYHVVMTRNTDAFVPLPTRVETATQAGSAIFVSIHYNSSRTPTAQGIEIFFFDSKENRSRTTASKKLADAILPRLIRRTQAQSRGVKKGNFYVIRETSMPAILIEGGFISNPQERALLKQRDYQEQIARGIADGIDQYFKTRWRSALRQ
jgi:N-acetylmuramoyl-L-alanine amidase